MGHVRRKNVGFYSLMHGLDYEAEAVFDHVCKVVECEGGGYILVTVRVKNLEPMWSLTAARYVSLFERIGE